MSLANRLDDLVKDFKYDAAHCSFKSDVFLWRGFLSNSLDALVHLTVSAEKHFKNVFSDFGVLKQEFLHGIVDSPDIIAHSA